MSAKGMSDTLYDVLGVPEDAAIGDIKRAFRRQARAVHPDTNPNAGNGHDAFRTLTQAYETLSDPTSRAAYDQGLLMQRTAPQGPGRNGAAGPTDDHTSARPDETGWAPSSAPGDVGFGEDTDEPSGWGEPDDGAGDDADWDLPDDDDPFGEAGFNIDDPDDLASYDDGVGEDFDDLIDDDDDDDDPLNPGHGWGEPDNPVDLDDRWDDSWGDDPWTDSEGQRQGQWVPDPVTGRWLEPAGRRHSTADRLTQVAWTAPAAWLAVTLLDGSPFRAIGDIWRWLQGSAGDAASDGENVRLWGELVGSTSRALLVLAVTTAAWLTVGGIVRMQNTRLPTEPRWWRSPGWDGRARLLRSGSWLALAWLLTATLLLPSVHEHIRAYEVAVTLHESTQDRPGTTQQGSLDDFFQTAQAEAAAGRWRVTLWTLALAATWIVTSRLPSWLGMPSRFERWILGELTLAA